MAKAKNKKQVMMEAKEIQKTRGKITKKIKKMVDKDFQELAVSVHDMDNKVVYDIKGFKQNFAQTIKTADTVTVQEMGKTMDKLYGVKDKIKNFEVVESKILNSYNKKYAANTVTKVTKTTEKKINNIITEKQKAGINAKQIAKEVRDNVEGMTKSRSLTIARTETAKAAGYANNELAKQGLSNRKVWVHTGGGKTDRKEHSDMNMLEIDIKDRFPNGLLYAHEPGASAEEVISCYCNTTYKFKY